MKILCLALIAALALAAPAARAADGTTDLLLNPAATTTISATGSYVVVGSVTMAAGIGAISVTANNVTIDLNGHTIASAGGGFAIGIDADLQAGLCVHSGTVSGFKGIGILAAGPAIAARIHDVRIDGCATGMSLGDNCAIRDCVITGSSGYGIAAGNRSLVEGCDASGNNTAGNSGGILAIGNSTVRNCVASNNAGTTDTTAIGIFAGSGCTLEGNTCNNNNGNGTGFGRGIQAGSGCTILHNTTTGNLGGATSGHGHGIFAANQCTIGFNTASNNDGGGSGVGRGIQAGEYCSVTNNTANDNDAGATGLNAYGIETSNNCAVSGNACNLNREGPGVAGTSYGISVGSDCLVESNSCGNNDASIDGSATGISALGGGNTLRNNNCSNNDADGTGSAAGIEVSSNCHVEGNTCTTNGGGAASFGIRIIGTGVTVIRNVTSANGAGGIAWISSGLSGRCEQNRMEGDGPIVNPPFSVGTGDLANVDF